MEIELASGNDAARERCENTAGAVSPPEVGMGERMAVDEDPISDVNLVASEGGDGLDERA